MKNLFTMILVGSMLLAGCATKEVTNDETLTEVAPPVEQEVPVVAEEPVATEPPVVAAVEEPEPEVERAADKIFFEFNSHQITPAGRKALEGNALWLQAQPEVRIVIAGHADERGSDRYNLTLGKKRAEAARDFLVAQGIAPERISTISYGEEKATKGAKDKLAWARDRRAEFVTTN